VAAATSLSISAGRLDIGRTPAGVTDLWPLGLEPGPAPRVVLSTILNPGRLEFTVTQGHGRDERTLPAPGSRKVLVNGRIGWIEHPLSGGRRSRPAGGPGDPVAITWLLPGGAYGNISGTMSEQDALELARATGPVAADDPRLTTLIPR
jgi:hypothetical protein